MFSQEGIIHSNNNCRVLFVIALCGVFVNGIVSIHKIGYVEGYERIEGVELVRAIDNT